MSELVRFQLGDQGDVVAELDDDEPGMERASRTGDVILAAKVDLGVAMERVRQVATVALDKLSQLPRRPETVEVEFGLRLNAEAGAVIARTEAEGHLKIKLTWHNPTSGSPDEK
jgi:Trypsin-co-occurring domain 1